MKELIQYTIEEIRQLGAIVDSFFNPGRDNYSKTLETLLAKPSATADPHKDAVLEFLCSYVGAPAEEVTSWLNAPANQMPALLADAIIESEKTGTPFVAKHSVAIWRMQLGR